MSSTVTSDFRHEFDQRMGQWLRKRFLWYTGIVSLISFFSLYTGLLYLTAIRYAPTDQFLRIANIESLSSLVPLRAALGDSMTVNLVLSTFGLALYCYEFLHAMRAKSQAQDEVLHRTSRLIIVNGFLFLLGHLIVHIITQAYDIPEAVKSQQIGPVTSIAVTHLFACLFLPWTWKQSLKPIIVLAIPMVPLTMFIAWGEWLSIILSLAMLPLALLPGILICLFRTSRFRKRFQFDMLRGSYGEMKRELTEAQRIHEALFPAPIEQGPIRFAYAYEAMKQLGGDFVYTHTSNNNQTLTLVLIDVTGHGLTAALTVNRLHGELAREFGASPNASPGDILTGLNDYLHYTLATHSVYATALCIQIDTTNDTLTWASAGHPPAFVMAVNGTLDRLDSTTIVLGACRGADFVADPQTITFRPGDTVFAYTDGIIETRGHDDKMLRIEGLQALLTTQPPDQAGGWCTAIMRNLEQLRAGPSQDDTLLVELYRPLNTTTPAKR